MFSSSLLKVTYLFSLLTASLLTTLPGALPAHSTSPGGIVVIWTEKSHLKNCAAQRPNSVFNIFFQLSCLPDNHSCKTFPISHTVDPINTGLGGEITRKPDINSLAMLRNAFFSLLIVTTELIIYTQNRYDKRPNPTSPSRPRLQNIHLYLSFQTHL